MKRFLAGAAYTRRADGRIDERTFARLKVRFAPAWLSFIPAVWGDYWIIGLADDYSWTRLRE